MTQHYGLLFPGQGSQSVGMLADLAAAFPVVESTFAEASAVLGYDLWELAQEGPAEQQKDTQFTQQLMLASGVACARVWFEKSDARPAAVAGHSVGEFAALVAAGALPFDAAVTLIRERAALMSSAVSPGTGGMAAVLGMDDADVVSVCQQASKQIMDGNDDKSGECIVEAVNFNAPGQVVISGHLHAIEQASVLAKESGARKVMPVPVSVPNHSALMRPAGDALEPHIDAIDWRMPDIPIVQNVHANTPADTDEMLTSLRVHVYSAVRWTQSISVMTEQFAINQFVELGPGKVLTGMGKRIDKSRPVFPVLDSLSLDTAIGEITAAATVS